MGCSRHFIQKGKNDFTNFLISRLKKQGDIICNSKSFSTPRMQPSPPSSYTNTNPPLRALVLEFIHYPYPSASISHPWKRLPIHSHTHTHYNSDTPHCWRIDYQRGFYWRVRGADTSALALLILLSYPNEPCVIHHCSTSGTQAAEGKAGLN